MDTKNQLWNWKTAKIINITLPKTNVAPANRVSQKESSLPTLDFQGLC